MTKTVTIYGYAFTSKSYAGGSGVYAIDMQVNLPDNANVQEFISMLIEQLEQENIKVYPKSLEPGSKGQLTYGVQNTDNPVKQRDIEDIAADLMDSAVRAKLETGKGKEVERNGSEQREQEDEY